MPVQAQADMSAFAVQYPLGREHPNFIFSGVCIRLKSVTCLEGYFPQRLREAICHAAKLAADVHRPAALPFAAIGLRQDAGCLHHLRPATQSQSGASSFPLKASSAPHTRKSLIKRVHGLYRRVTAAAAAHKWPLPRTCHAIRQKTHDMRILICGRIAPPCQCGSNRLWSS